MENHFYHAYLRIQSKKETVKEQKLEKKNDDEQHVDKM